MIKWRRKPPLSDRLQCCFAETRMGCLNHIRLANLSIPFNNECNQHLPPYLLRLKFFRIGRHNLINNFGWHIQVFQIHDLRLGLRFLLRSRLVFLCIPRGCSRATAQHNDQH